MCKITPLEPAYLHIKMSSDNRLIYKANLFCLPLAVTMFFIAPFQTIVFGKVIYDMANIALKTLYLPDENIEFQIY